MKKHWTTILSILAYLALVCGTTACKNKSEHSESSATSDAVSETNSSADESSTNNDVDASDIVSENNSSVGHEPDDSQTSAHSHEYASTTVDPTCTKVGVTTYTCVCGDTYTVKRPALGHTEVIDGAVAATCTETGLTEGKHCSVCNEVLVKQEKISVAEHIRNDMDRCETCGLNLGTEGIVYGYISSDDTKSVAVLKYEGTATNVVIADTYKGLPVTVIASSAFYNCDNLTSVMIPDSVTDIYSEAFYDCNNLTSVVMGDGVTSIDSYAFKWCDTLMHITIGTGVSYIGTEAFANCLKLVEVVNKSTHITVRKNSSNGWVGNFALAIYNSGDIFVDSKLSNDNGYIVYTDGWEKILIGYQGTETHLILPSYITKINAFAFYNCKNLEKIVISDGVTSIGSSAFYYCNNLTTVVIPNSVTSITDNAFYQCGITDIAIPDSVTSIGKNAFRNCYSLMSITISNSVTSIGESAFTGCYSLAAIYYRGTASDWAEIDISKYNECLTDATLYYYSE